jgi:hypothetical protein
MLQAMLYNASEEHIEGLPGILVRVKNKTLMYEPEGPDDVADLRDYFFRFPVRAERRVRFWGSTDPEAAALLAEPCPAPAASALTRAHRRLTASRIACLPASDIWRGRFASPPLGANSFAFRALNDASRARTRSRSASRRSSSASSPFLA